MKSTDMFISAKARKLLPNPIVLPEQNAPEGEKVSPYVIDLWKNERKNKIKKIPNVQLLNENEIPSLINPKNPEEITKQELEKLIEQRLEGKNKKLSSEKNIFEQKTHHNNEKPFEEENITFHSENNRNNTPPSREAQIAKIKEVIQQFEVFQKTVLESDEKGFFRNLKKIL